MNTRNEYSHRHQVASSPESSHWVESHWLALESESIHLNTVWFKVESLMLLKNIMDILHKSLALQGKKLPPNAFPTALHPPPPPPPRSTTFRYSESNMLNHEPELNQFKQISYLSWISVQLFSQLTKIWDWVESELSHVNCHMRQCRLSPKNLSRAQPWPGSEPR